MHTANNPPFINSIHDARSADPKNSKRIKASLLNGDACADPRAFLPDNRGSLEEDFQPQPLQLQLDSFDNFGSPSSNASLPVHTELRQPISFGHLSSEMEHKDAKALASKPGIIFNSKEEEDRKSLGKQVAKIKYYWRGTNMNYPFAFQRVRLLQSNTAKKQIDFENPIPPSDIHSNDDNNTEDGIIFEEDLSNKVINPADKFYK